MEASRPLWEKEFKSVKEFEQKLKELLKRLLKENAAGNSSANTDCGLNTDEDDNEDGQNDIDPVKNGQGRIQMAVKQKTGGKLQ